MKKVHFIITILILPFGLKAQWQKSNLDTIFSLNTASFLNKDTFLISSDNILQQTTNGGETFNSVANYAAGSASYLVYKSYDSIYLAGAGTNTKGLLVSYDAGTTWVKQTLLMPNGDTAFKKKNILFFGFFDKSNGIIFGDSLNGTPQVFLTQNGGLTWEFYSDSSVDAVVYSDIDLFNLYATRQNSCLFGDGSAKLLIGLKNKFLTIKRFGRDWSIDSDTSRKYSKIAFKDPLNGLAKINLPSGLARTNDGGLSWVEIKDSLGKSNGNLMFVPGTSKHLAFYLSSTPKSTGESNVSYDDGDSWQLFDTLNHGNGTVFFRDAESGVCSELSLNKSPVYYYKPTSVGLKETLKEPFSELYCYPNPADVLLSFSTFYQRVELWDVQGRLAGSFSHTDRIDLSSFTNGLYWIKATDKNGSVYTQKVLIQH